MSVKIRFALLFSGAVVVLLMTLGHAADISSASPPVSIAPDASANTPEHHTPANHAVVSRDGGWPGPMTTHPDMIESRGLRAVAEANSGLQMGSAAFHRFPSNSLISVYSWSVRYITYNLDGTISATPTYTQVDLRKDKILTRGASAIEVTPSSIAGFFDVRAMYPRAVYDYAQERQLASDRAVQLGLWPDDRGVALIHNDTIYKDWTYGEFANACQNNQWVILIAGTSQTEADTIANAMRL